MYITIEITEKRLRDLLAGHVGRMSDWLKEASVYPISGNFERAVCVYDLEGDEEGTFKGKSTVTRSGIARGLATMAKVAPYQFGQFLDENDDDVTFDIAWQCIIFDKLVYA